MKVKFIKTETGYKAVKDDPNILNGGEGSGDWGHKGRPGKVGGSGLGKIEGQKDNNLQKKKEDLIKPTRQQEPYEGENMDILKEILALCKTINNKLK